jgi:5-(carboxyamino)imidazole ribonucleotide synthase
MLAQFASACGVVTFEFENVPAATFRMIARHSPVRPCARTAEVAQDRIAEKRFLTSLGLPIAPHATLECEEDLVAAAAFLASAGRAILKRARNGYDGKGQSRVASAELEESYKAFGCPCVLEAILPFKTEISVIAVREASGAMQFYDCPENNHAGGILRSSEVPAPISPELQSAAQSITERIAAALGYVGVLGVELFVMPEDDAVPLRVNEIAPRVHNSGHWTLDACIISQFENHIRAVAGWPLGSTNRHSDATMTNLLGDDVRAWRDILQNDPSASLYLYGKSSIRAGRKLGHVTRIQPRKKK